MAVIAMQFCENLKHYRKLRGFSRKGMAEKLNIKTASYGNYEQGRTKPDTDKLRIIAETLQVSTDELLNFHLNELQRCINRWNNAGFKVEVYNKPLFESTEFEAAFKSELNKRDILKSEEKKDFIIVYNKDSIKSMKDKPLDRITFEKNNFINLTKKLYDKSKELAQSQFTNIAETYFMKSQASLPK